MLTRGIVIFAHGSSIASANESVREVTSEFARLGGYPHVETAFLELAQPDLEMAIAALAERGVKEICVVPYFLTMGIHLQQDLPRLLREIAAKHVGVSVLIAAPLAGHPALAQALIERAREAMA